MVAHDTNNPDDWPQDWEKDERIKGGKVHTSAEGTGYHTTIIQGNLDTTGEIFARAVSILEAGETSHFYRKYNAENNGWGSHIRLISAAALATSGDILELGSGYFSTPMLHQIIEDEVAKSKSYLKTNIVLKGGRRMLISADTELGWLYKFHNLSSSFHQFIGNLD